MSNMSSFRLQSNVFTGTIPPGISALSKLVHLDVHGNMLTGPIQSSLTKLTKMEYLLLGKNMFSGMIPSGLFVLSKLKLLDLAATALTGPFPTTAGDNVCPLRLDGIASNSKTINSTGALIYTRKSC